MRGFDFEAIGLRSDDAESLDFFPPHYRIGRTKYIIVTGGVMSGVGKGVFTASLAHLLQFLGFSVSVIKIDGYLNLDAGTLNPYRHGETFVLDDGTECDLDLGTYERFLDTTLNRNNYMTSGKIYSRILAKERRGEYLGRDVQIVPHVTGEIKYLIREKAKEGPYDMVLVEIGGTVGDIENLHFIEAARELMNDEGRDNIMFAHVTVVPWSDTTGEQKSKPTQHSVKKLLEMGIQPDIIVCRSKDPLQRKVREKISLHCNVPIDHVISSPDVESIYTLPFLFQQQRLAEITVHRLHLNMPYPAKEDAQIPFEPYVQHVQRHNPTLTVAVTGKYSSMRDSYISITNALQHTEPFERVRINLRFIDTTEYDDPTVPLHKCLDGVHGIIVPGGYGLRGTEGMIRFIQYAREQQLPYLGLCLGFQLAAIEFARHVCGLEKATSTEFDPHTPEPVISLLPEQETIRDLGGTQRLGGHEVVLLPGTRVHHIYGKDVIRERFRHRYELNNLYKDTLEKAGLLFCGMTPDHRIMQILDYPAHPFFIATQFHPEWTSRPLRPHPLFREFIRAAKRHQEQ
ncbi:MAG: CTP synthetase [Candidatus Tectimicrobiota bacterium]|nr:MAG: CTP synthetase [Candidatus Tectomicrobia bacterium]